jgi:hypothetical protein
MTTSPDQAQQVPAPRPPDDKEELEQEIAATRERLGATVGELAAKLDVKSQARAQVSRLKGRVTGTARQAGAQATAQSGKLRGQLTATAARAKGKAADTAGQARGQAASAAHSVPEPARRAAATGAGIAKRRPVQIGAAVGVLIAAIVAVLLRRKR